MTIPEDFSERIIQRVLTARKIGVNVPISMSMIASADFRMIEDFLGETIIAQLRTFLWSEPVRDAKGVKIFLVPDGAWQMFKRDHMPRWFVRRWPVRNIRWHVEIEATEWRTYPEAEIPLPPKYGRTNTVIEFTTNVEREN